MVLGPGFFGEGSLKVCWNRPYCVHANKQGCRGDSGWHGTLLSCDALVILANPGDAVNRLVRGWVHTLASPLRAIDKVRDVTVMILNQKIKY